MVDQLTNPQIQNTIPPKFLFSKVRKETGHKTRKLVLSAFLCYTKTFIKITPNSNDSRVLRFIYFIQTCTFTCILVNHASTHVPLLPPDGFLAQRIVSPDSFFCLTRMGGHTDPSGAVSGCRGHPAASARGGSPRGSRNIPPTWREYYCQKRRTSKKKKVNVWNDGLLVSEMCNLQHIYQNHIQW